MTRGNQRELARAKNLKKAEAGKKKDDGLTATARKERDADVMRQKQQAAAAKKEGGAAAPSGSSGKKWRNLEDLTVNPHVLRRWRGVKRGFPSHGQFSSSDHDHVFTSFVGDFIVYTHFPTFSVGREVRKKGVEGCLIVNYFITGIPDARRGSLYFWGSHVVTLP